jgi:hypothetical protein
MAIDTESTLSPRTSGVEASPDGAKSPAAISTGTSSTFSDLSFSKAKRNLQEDILKILNPGGVGLVRNENRWTWLPLLFALLPALGGMVHTNGAAFISDIMLLSLAGVFLYWSVTQPW